MSILLEALKQKNKREQSRVEPTAQVNPVESGLRSEPNIELSLANNTPRQASTSDAEPMDDLLTQLDIKAPKGLNWQLSAMPRHDQTASPDKSNLPEPVNETAPTLPPLTLDLILPKSGAESIQSTQSEAAKIEQPVNSIPLEPEPQPIPVADMAEALSISRVEKPAEPTPTETVESKVNAPIETVNQSSAVVDDADDASNTPSRNAQTNTNSAGLKPTPELVAPITAVKLPEIDKTPFSAQRFLSFAQRLKPAVSNASETLQSAALTPSSHQPSAYQYRKSFVIVGGVLVSLGVLSYTTLMIWESQQQAHLQNMARYKSQSLTDFPEKPQLTPPVAPVVAENTPALSDVPNPQPVETAEPSQTAKTTQAQPVVEAKQPLLRVSPSSQSDAGITSMPVLDTTRRTPKTATSWSDETLKLQQTQPTAEWLMLAYQAWQQGNSALAESYYRQVLEKQPTQKDALMGMLAIAQLDARQLPSARDYADQLMRLYPTDAQVRLATEGIASTVNNERLSESELKQRQRYDGQSAEASFRLGLLYAEQQRWSEAQSAFFEAVKTAPSNSAYRLNLAVSYDQLGKYRLAADHYQTLLEQRPNKLTEQELAMVRQRVDYLMPFVSPEP